MRRVLPLLLSAAQVDGLANLYRPAKAGKAMLGFLLSHSHHSPRRSNNGCWNG